MKKNIFKIMLLLLTIGLMVVSCKKDTVNDSNSQQAAVKISKIYYHYLSEDSSEDTRYLAQKWHWNSNGNLESIEYFSSTGEVVSRETHVYDGNLLMRINFWNTWDGEAPYHWEMVYENGNIREMRYYEENFLEMSYTLTYANGYVSNIIMREYEMPFQKNTTDRSDALRQALPEQLSRIIEVARGKSRGTSQETEEYVASIALTWSGDNVSRADLSSTYNGVTNQGQYTMEYDTYNNPYCGILNEDMIGEGFQYFSKNNVVRESFMMDGESESWTYEYTYENQNVKTKREGSYNYVEFEYM